MTDDDKGLHAQPLPDVFPTSPHPYRAKPTSTHLTPSVPCCRIPLTCSDTNPVESSSELRDVDFQPSSLVHASVTIIHPQLRDLILPLERGHIIYPHVMTLESMRWPAPEKLSPRGDDTGDLPTPSPWERCYEEAMSGFYAGRPPGRAASPAKPQPAIRTLFKLDFTPTCLTTK